MSATAPSRRRLAVILPAAGSSTRFGGATNKLLADLAGQPVLARSLAAFLSRPDVVAVVIPTSLPLSDFASPALAAALSDPRVVVCPGGPSRAASVAAALSRVRDDVEWVAVHDAARPLVPPDLIDRVFVAAAEAQSAAAPAMPVALTVKQAAGPLPALVERTVPRQSLWVMQTPQVMRREALSRAYDACPLPLDQITDDAQLLELAGQPVWLVEGDERNLKITTATDLRLAAMLLEDAKT